MELWELNSCVRAHNKKQQSKGKEQLATCWQTAAFTGAAFGGKLKKLSRYIKDDKKTEAPKISKQEFEEKLRQAEARGKDNGT